MATTRSLFYFHHTFVQDLTSGEVLPVVSVREPDKWSGRAHGHVWSSDSRALILVGEGLVEGGQLPLVFFPRTQQLVSVELPK